MAAQLFSEEVDLVEEDDERGFLEEDRVENLIKEFLTLSHSVGGVVFIEHLVEVTQGDDEEDCKWGRFKSKLTLEIGTCSDVVKALDPLFPLTALAPNIHQFKFELWRLKKKIINHYTIVVIKSLIVTWNGTTTIPVVKLRALWISILVVIFYQKIVMK